MRRARYRAAASGSSGDYGVDVMTLLLAQISDLHLDGSERATRRAERVMNHLRALPRRPDAVLVTGDIADHGEEAEYEEAARLLKAPFPVYLCPGNHDERSAYRTVLLSEPPGDGPVNRAHHVPGAVILMCDSTVPGRDEGRLAPETLDWIDATLEDEGMIGPDDKRLLVTADSPAEVCAHVREATALQKQLAAGFQTEN